MVDKKLGKISAVRFGWGGYQDAQFGISFSISGDGWGWHDFWGFWGSAPSVSAQWSQSDQIRHFGETALRIRDILVQAKKRDVSELVGIPVEITTDGLSTQAWRVLTEVL